MGNRCLLDMEIGYPMSSKQKLKAEDLLKAVRTSDSSVFKSLSLKQLAEVFFLKNEDTHSLLRVAISSALPFCPSVPSSNDKQQRRRQSLRHQGSQPSRPHQHRRSSLPTTLAPSLTADAPPLGHSKPTATPLPLLRSTVPGTGPTGNAPQAPLVHQSHHQPN
ncbi:hypothetical protein C1H46_017450 [Malus baccata]|uniref:Uncharacterized protein n=1 Tax=Malus baccata TaxID=106549 RepID=A0A540MDZ0_MALBA|nr:hypothetical protein C1H46_017450 [Malus baccata]